MNNINAIDKNNYTKKHSSWKNLGYALMLTGLLNVNTPTYANSNNYRNITTEQIRSKSNSINGIKLPTIYQNKLDDFLLNNIIMKDIGTKEFTINFVEKEMESDRGISKENQLLFIRHSIYKQITNQDLYDGKDGNQKIAEDFNNKVINARIKACGQKYRSGFTTYTNQRSADAQQRSADAQQRSADAQQRSADAQQRSADAQQRSADAQQEAMKLDSLRLKEDILKFYDIYTRSPEIVKREEIDFMKKATKECITQCIKYGIDYRAILLKEVGDPQKVNAILKFYEIEN